MAWQCLHKLKFASNTMNAQWVLIYTLKIPFMKYGRSHAISMVLTKFFSLAHSYISMQTVLCVFFGVFKCTTEEQRLKNSKSSYSLDLSNVSAIRVLSLSL